MSAQFRFLSGARAGVTESSAKAYIAIGRHPLSDVRFDAERDLDVSTRHAAILRRGDGYVLQDVGSKNGTYVNGVRVSGDTPLKDGDVIGFGAKGPALEFRVVAGAAEAAPDTTQAETAAARMSQPRAVVPAAAPRGSSTTTRIRLEVARQTRSLRARFLVAFLTISLAAFAWIKVTEARAGRDVARLQLRADSLNAETTRLLSQFQDQIQSVRQALQQSQAEVTRLRSQLAVTGSGDPAELARLRSALEEAETRQRGIAGAAAVDYRVISQQNQDAVALVIVEFSETERFSGTAFAVDSQGTLVTNKHVLAGDAGNRTPTRIAVKFSGSRQWFRGTFVGVADDADIGVLRVSIAGGTPRVLGIERNQASLERGDPVAIIGYPLGYDLPMDGRRGTTEFVAEPTLTVGTASKVLSDIVQVDGYGAPGSSGSPIFDRNGHVVAVLYGGVAESNGKIIYAVPVSRALAFLRQRGIRVP